MRVSEQCVNCGGVCVSVTYGLELLRMKKALPSGMGGIFSLRLSSDSLCGLGRDGTSGSSSSSSSTHTQSQ